MWKKNVIVRGHDVDSGCRRLARKAAMLAFACWNWKGSSAMRACAVRLSPGTSRKMGTIGACHGFPHVTHDPPINPPLPPLPAPPPNRPPRSPSFPLTSHQSPPASMQRAIAILPTDQPSASGCPTLIHICALNVRTTLRWEADSFSSRQSGKFDIEASTFASNFYSEKYL